MLVIKHFPFDSDHAPWRYSFAGEFADCWTDQQFIERVGGGTLTPYKGAVPFYELPKGIITGYEALWLTPPPATEAEKEEADYAQEEADYYDSW